MTKYFTLSILAICVFLIVILMTYCFLPEDRLVVVSNAFNSTLQSLPFEFKK